MNPSIRQRIAQLTASIMIQEGINDYHFAKCKAANQLGLAATPKNLPSNTEVIEEVTLYQRLYQADTQPQLIQHLRQIALKAMKLLADFSPCLVGSVLDGTAHSHSHIVLHLFADQPEEVAFFLMERNMPYQLSEKKYRLVKETVFYPCYQFMAGEQAIHLVVFQTQDTRWSPPSSIDGKPTKRAKIGKLEKLLQCDPCLS